MTDRVGAVQSLWRYPVRSMRGESLDVVEITSRGVVGDRCYGVVDVEKDCAAEASHVPLRWAGLLSAQAVFAEEPRAGSVPPPISIRFDDGAQMSSEAPGLASWLAERLGHPTALRRDEDAGGASLPGGAAEASGAAHSMGAEREPSGALLRGYDRAPIHLVTTASLRAAAAIHTKGEFVPARFRPNIVLDTGEAVGFIESEWIGRSLALGPVLRLEVMEPCERCVLPTLPQGDLRRDPRILATVAAHNDTHMGIYARVVTPGRLRRGEAAKLG